MRRSPNRLLCRSLVLSAGLVLLTVDAHAQTPQPPGSAAQPSSYVVDSSQLTPTPVSTAPSTPTPSTTAKPRVAPKPRVKKVAPGTPTTLDVRILDPNTTPSVATVAGPSASQIRTGDATFADSVWVALRKCESNGNYAINTGNGYYGAYQFAAGTWRKLGYSGLPHEASPAIQDEAARKLQAQQGWSPWPACTRKLGLR